MAVRIDYHLHLRRPSRENGVEEIDHTPGAVERFVEVAAERGVDELGFTEHVYYFRQARELWSLPYYTERGVYDLDRYCDAVVEAKRRGLPVKLGLEVDYVAGKEEETRALLAPYPWDFLLGSVHDVEGEHIDVDPEEGLWKRFPVEEVWRGYFGALGAAATSGLFDALSHPDLVKVFGLRPSADEVRRLHEQTAAVLGSAAVAVEVSSSGLHKPVGEVYPDAAFLEECRSRGVPITTASDAHEPRDVGRDLDRAAEHAREAGYETVTVFDRRRARQEPLG